MRIIHLVLKTETACFPIAAWYVLRGDWLWSGKTMREEQTPRMREGSISA